MLFTYLGVLELDWNFVSINFRCSSSVPIRPHVLFIWFRLEPLLPPSPMNLRLLFKRLIPLSLPLLLLCCWCCLLLLLLILLLLFCGLKKSSFDDSWTFKPFAVIPVTRIMWVGRRKIVGIGSGSSPCWARAVNERAHNFLRTPMMWQDKTRQDNGKSSSWNLIRLICVCDALT